MKKLLACTALIGKELPEQSHISISMDYLSLVTLPMHLPIQGSV